MAKHKIEPGLLCFFDKNNVMDQSEAGILMVEVVRKVKHRFFRRSIWLVKDLKSDVEINVPERLLDTFGACVIRNPACYPKFNKEDLDACKNIVDFFNENKEAFIKYESFNKSIKRFDVVYEKIRQSYLYDKDENNV